MRTVYIENEVADHPLALAILSRLGIVEQIRCDRYTEVFNRSAQNFRLQKQKPAIILARKHDRHVLAAPPDYGLPGVDGYYFSTTLNCPYDCRYCFLQGMYRSAHHVIFVNYEDFAHGIEAHARAAEGAAWFNAGYDNDSLAFDSVTGAVGYFVPLFADLSKATLELRTKSAYVKPLTALDPVNNVVCAFSLAPERVARSLEHRAPSLSQRIDAIAQLQAAGWRVGVRIEPVIVYRGYQREYTELIARLKSILVPAMTHSISYGSYRMPIAFHRRIATLYPDDAFFASAFEKKDGLMTYGSEALTAIDELFGAQLKRYLDYAPRYRCGAGGAMSA